MTPLLKRNTITSIKFLYRELTLYNLVFTAISVKTLILHGASSYPYIFWIKVAGHVFTFTVYYWYRKKYLYFFHNLNINKRYLMAFSIIVDSCITLFVLTLTNYLFVDQA